MTYMIELFKEKTNNQYDFITIAVPENLNASNEPSEHAAPGQPGG